MKRLMTSILAAALTAALFAAPVSADEHITASIIPTADPNFVEMSLVDFREANPNYQGYIGSEKNYVSLANSIYDTYYEWKMENGYYYLYRYQIVNNALVETKMINYWYQDSDTDYWYYSRPRNSSRSSTVWSRLLLRSLREETII